MFARKKTTYSTSNQKAETDSERGMGLEKHGGEKEIRENEVEGRDREEKGKKWRKKEESANNSLK